MLKGKPGRLRSPRPQRGSASKLALTATAALRACPCAAPRLPVRATRACAPAAPRQTTYPRHTRLSSPCANVQTCFWGKMLS